MKKFGLFMLLAFVGLSSLAAAASNPQMRACRVASGQFFVLDTGLDQIGLCRLGPSVIGAIDLLNKDADVEDVPASIYEYRNGVTFCEPAHVASFPNPNGTVLKVCYYDDGSIIDLQTLVRGKNHPQNYSLSKALDLLN